MVMNELVMSIKVKHTVTGMMSRPPGGQLQKDYLWSEGECCQRPKEPLTVDEAVASPDKGEWKTAMEKEMKSLKENEVWELVELPEGRKAVGRQ